MSVVLDNSVVIDWLIEPNPRDGVDELIRREQTNFIVPSLFWSEVAYVLGKREANGRITRQFRLASLRRVQALEVTTDLSAAAPGPSFDHTLELCDRHSLTVYDAVYLELALRRGFRLATLDNALAGAARSLGLEVLPAA
jgi:predicted nucleic acid-binding protein